MRVLWAGEDVERAGFVCPVCKQRIKAYDKVVLVAVQRTRTSVAIPVHAECWDGEDIPRGIKCEEDLRALKKGIPKQRNGGEPYGC